MARLHSGQNGRLIVASSLSVSDGARDIGFVGASRPPLATCVASRRITEPRSVHTHVITAARRMRHFVILRSNQLMTKPIAVGRRTRPIMATDAAETILTAVNAGATRRYYYTSVLVTCSWPSFRSSCQNSRLPIAGRVCRSPYSQSAAAILAQCCVRWWERAD